MKTGIARLTKEEQGLNIEAKSTHKDLMRYAAEQQVILGEMTDAPKEEDAEVTEGGEENAAGEEETETAKGTEEGEAGATGDGGAGEGEAGGETENATEGTVEGTTDGETAGEEGTEETADGDEGESGDGGRGENAERSKTSESEGETGGDTEAEKQGEARGDTGGGSEAEQQAEDEDRESAKEGEGSEDRIDVLEGRVDELEKQLGKNEAEAKSKVTLLKGGVRQIHAAAKTTLHIVAAAHARASSVVARGSAGAAKPARSIPTDTAVKVPPVLASSTGTQSMLNSFF